MARDFLKCWHVEPTGPHNGWTRCAGGVQQHPGPWPHRCHTSLQRGSQRGAQRTSLPPQPHHTENTSLPVLPVMSLPPLSCRLPLHQAQPYLLTGRKQSLRTKEGHTILMLNYFTNYSAEQCTLIIDMGMVHKIVYYMIQGLIMPLIYYIKYLPYGTHKCTLYACQTGPPYSPFAGDRHQCAPRPPSIFCFQAFCLY